jgi:thioredoxin reductase
MNNFREHTLKTGTEILYDMVYEIKKVKNFFEAKTSL